MVQLTVAAVKCENAVFGNREDFQVLFLGKTRGFHMDFQILRVETVGFMC